ncbi:hypothetical protein P1X14_14910 [Sphingomonas sp. AOB5]|uniref:hypothetical protein n=1 Tax=Sphingomonas sp. AOB5 TaxID=3034017 RepID=UPI0023F9D361|nr:hypothetical protein [Sphingomonas sp. AOB5]MDF7776544.1 hypothetical protein [Sphingomonas sp. AOB5]
MNDLSPAQLALRVAIFAAVLGAIGWMPPGLHLLAGAVLTIIALALFWEAWSRRRSPRALRTHLFSGMLATGGAVVLVSGLVGYLATPLLALAGVCGALFLVAKLGENDAPSSEE